jgi:two-component system, cell cycle response regulator
MRRVLTVDDSRAVRSIVAKNMTEWGFEVDEAEDGVKGLEKLEEVKYDLIILDVTMPEMDGPTMLENLRKRGDQTPVIMLTSESKKSIVAGAMKQGIEDYILKPFKPEELKEKVFKVVKGGPGGGSAAIVAEPVRSSGDDGGGGARKFCDVLLIDDMVNVHKRFRQLLPEKLSMATASSATAALELARERFFRVVIIDNVIPDVDSLTLMRQLRVVQGQASFLTLTLRTTTGKPDVEARTDGWDGVVFKPFAPEDIDALMGRYFGDQELVTVEDNVLTIGTFTGKEDKLDAYFQRLNKIGHDELEKLAAACYDEVLVNAASVPVNHKAVRFVKALADDAARLHLSLRLRGSGEMAKMLASVTDTAVLPFEVAA